MRAVIDTNTIISAFFFPKSIPREVFDYVRRNGKLLMSFDTFDELTLVIHRPKFNKYSLYNTRREFIEALSKEVERVQVTEIIQACKDSNDDKFLELAVAGEAEVIITGDGFLKELNPFRGINILSKRFSRRIYYGIKKGQLAPPSSFFFTTDNSLIHFEVAVELPLGDA